MFDKPMSQLDRIEAKLDLLLEKKKRKPKPFEESQRHVFIGNEFARWWYVYPKKKGKADACKAFHAIAKTKRDEEAIKDFTDCLITDIQNRLRQDEAWMNGQIQYLPHPATWLRGERWNDDITQAATQLPKENDELYRFAIEKGMREPHVGESWINYRKYVEGKVNS
jgi:hypothetical protein